MSNANEKWKQLNPPAGYVRAYGVDCLNGSLFNETTKKIQPPSSTTIDPHPQTHDDIALYKESTLVGLMKSAYYDGYTTLEMERRESNSHELKAELSATKEKLAGLEAAASFWQEKAGRYSEEIESMNQRIRIQPIPPELAELQDNGCSRSHPHENMNGYCKLRTVIDRLENGIVHLKLDNAELRKQLESREGWQLVPIEPTEYMLKYALDCQDFDPADNDECEAYEKYKAMLKAAPKP